MEIPFSLTENGYENTPFVRKSGGFLPVKTGKSASKIALKQRRSVFLRSNSENFPFRRMKQRLFDSKTGDFAVSLDERKEMSANLNALYHRSDHEKIGSEYR